MNDREPVLDAAPAWLLRVVSVVQSPAGRAGAAIVRAAASGFAWGSACIWVGLLAFFSTATADKTPATVGALSQQMLSIEGPWMALCVGFAVARFAVSDVGRSLGETMGARIKARHEEA